MPEKLIILDRDGVINHDSDDYIKSVDEWRPIKGSAAAVAKLNNMGYKVAVATNQSGLSRGFFDLVTLSKIHQKMREHLAEHDAHLDEILFCPDHPDNPGPNRKPAPGMALELLSRFNANAQNTWFVGDSLSDVQCAINSGCKPALVLTGKGARTINKPAWQNYRVPVFDDLSAFVAHLGD